MATRSSRTQIVLRPQAATHAIRRSAPSRRHQTARRVIHSLRRRASNSSDDTKTTFATIGAPVLLTLLEKKSGFVLPSVAGLHPNLVWGGLGVLFAKKVFGTGEMGRLVRAASLGVAVTGATDATVAGSPMTSAKKATHAKSKLASASRRKKKAIGGDDDIGDDEVGDDIGDDEVGDDDIGDDEVGDD